MVDMAKLMEFPFSNDLGNKMHFMRNPIGDYAKRIGLKVKSFCVL